MVIIMKIGASTNEIQNVANHVRSIGLDPRVITGVERTIVAVVGDERDKPRITNLGGMPGVEKITPISKPYKLASRAAHPDRSVIRIGADSFGNNKFGIIAGPCAIENMDQALTVGRMLAQCGVRLMRFGLCKPRTSPYSFQGLRNKGVPILKAVREETGLGFVSEVMGPLDIELLLGHVDAFQVGARNMQNYDLLQQVGRTKTPIILKRGMAATLTELLMAAEYILAQGNHNVVLCERGIRSFDSEHTRNVLDLSAIPVIKQETHLPVIADPSHATGVRSLVPDMAHAAIMAGADGLLIEVHPNPEQALSDGPQSLLPKQFTALMEEVQECRFARERIQEFRAVRDQTREAADDD